MRVIHVHLVCVRASGRRWGYGLGRCAAAPHKATKPGIKTERATALLQTLNASAAARGPHTATTKPAADAHSKPAPLLQVQEEDVGGDLTPMPELQHNMRLLVDVAEADIRRLDARLRHEQVSN